MTTVSGRDNVIIGGIILTNADLICTLLLSSAESSIGVVTSFDKILFL
jgi:ABC-type cobalamin transport system permease subunit